MADQVKFTKTMTTETDKLGKLADAIRDKTGEAGKAQQTYFRECSRVGVNFKPEQAQAIFKAALEDTPSRAALMSQSKKFADPKVAPHADALWAKADEIKDKGSIVGAASKLATRLKSGDADTVEQAAAQIAVKKKTDDEKKKTPEGAVERTVKSVKHHMGLAGYTDKDLAPVLEALNVLKEQGPSEPEPEEAQDAAAKEDATIDVGDAAPAASLEEMLTQGLVADGFAKPQAREMARVMLLAKKS
jgi:hypothetical protein